MYQGLLKLGGRSTGGKEERGVILLIVGRKTYIPTTQGRWGINGTVNANVHAIVVFDIGRPHKCGTPNYSSNDMTSYLESHLQAESYNEFTVFTLE